MKRCLPTPALLLVMGCGAAPVVPDGPVTPTAADALFEMLQGSFDSSAQAAADETYYDISLVMCIADAPALGERVLYVEQAASATPDAPYRQRAYVVRDGDQPSVAISDVYAFTDEARWVGACSAVPEFGPDDVTIREGCSVRMTRVGDTFVGATGERSCGSTLRGASYATSEVTVSADLLESWDRGFDADGAHVWGAELGPYRFVRRTER